MVPKVAYPPQASLLAGRPRGWSFVLCRAPGCWLTRGSESEELVYTLIAALPVAAAAIEL